MVFFGKKKNKSDASGSTEPVQEAVQSTNESDGSDEKGSKKTAKKKKSPLYQIFRESVWETVREDFQRNDGFIHTEKDGSDKFVGLVLDVETIGGLDKRSRKNESKGTMIQVINSGKIKTYITCDLMDENCIMFVPDALTLSEMDNFTLLSEAKYELGFVDLAGNIELLGVYTTYKEVVDLCTGDGHVDALLKDLPDESESVSDTNESGPVPLDEDLLKDVAPSPSTVAEEQKSEPVISDMTSGTESQPEPVLDDDDDIEPLEEELEEFDANSEGLSGSGNTGSAVSSGPQSAPSGYQQQPSAYETAMQEEPIQEQEDTIPPEWTADMLTRRFYSDDLGLEVSTDPFDAMFMHQNVFVPFDENRPEGWINDQLNEISREANADMARLHQNNLFIMRERYFKLMASQCDRIQRDLDVSNESTQYGQMLSQLRMALDDARADIGIIVEKKKAEIEKRWRTTLQEIGMDAAREAQRQYRDRYGDRHNLEIYGIEDSVKASIEADFNDSVHDLYDRRRMEASSLLDLSITETLDELASMYTSCMEEEQLRYQEWQERMHVFVEDNRKADIARMDTLAEDLRQKERADQVLADQTAKIRTMTQDHNNKRKELMDEIAKLRADNQADIERMKRESSEELAKMQAEKDALEAKFNDLLDKYSKLDQTKDEEYKERMEELRDEVYSWEDKCDHMASVHKRNNINSVFFVVAAVVAALCIGFVGGEFISISRQTKSEYRAIVEDHQKQLDKAKSSVTSGNQDKDAASDKTTDTNQSDKSNQNKDGKDAGK